MRHRSRPAIEPLGARSLPSSCVPCTLPEDVFAGPSEVTSGPVDGASIPLPEDVFAPLSSSPEGTSPGLAAGVGSALSPSGTGLPVMIGD